MMIDEKLFKDIREKTHLKNSIYHNLNISATIEYFTKRYVEPISKHIDIRDAICVDCASGYGWFSMAYAMAGGKHVIAVDIDEERLSIVKQFADIMSIGNHMTFVNSAIQDITLKEDEVDIFVSIETLEHITKSKVKKALKKIRDCTSQAIIITTPNRIFPVVAHDTRLPFLHWLPANRRTLPSRIFGRENMNYKNEFLSPFDLRVLLDKFKSVSTCLTFTTFKDYIKQFPYYLPYGDNEERRWQTKPSFAKTTYFMAASKIFGRNSYWVMPSLATVFLRR